MLRYHECLCSSSVEAAVSKLERFSLCLKCSCCSDHKLYRRSESAKPDAYLLVQLWHAAPIPTGGAAVGSVLISVPRWSCGAVSATSSTTVLVMCAAADAPSPASTNRQGTVSEGEPP